MALGGTVCCGILVCAVLENGWVGLGEPWHNLVHGASLLVTPVKDFLPGNDAGFQTPHALFLGGNFVSEIVVS